MYTGKQYFPERNCKIKAMGKYYLFVRNMIQLVDYYVNNYIEVIRLYQHTFSVVSPQAFGQKVPVYIGF